MAHLHNIRKGPSDKKEDNSGQLSASISCEECQKRKRVLVQGAKLGLALLGLRLGLWGIKAIGKRLFRKGSSNGEQVQQAATGSVTATHQTSQELPQEYHPSAHWRPLEVAPPALPLQDFKQLASATLPCSVYGFYHYILSHQSQFLQQQHEQESGQFNFDKRCWSPSPLDLADYPYIDDQSMLQSLNKSVFEFVLGAGGSGSFVRTVSFTTPKKPPTQNMDANCVQRHQFAVFSGNVLIMATCMNMLNIPFKDCFTVNTIWEVKPAASGGCTCNIYGKVHFVKSTLVSGIIRATSYRDLETFYKAVMVNANNMLSTAQPVPEPSMNVEYIPEGPGRRLLRRLSSRHRSQSGGLASSSGAAMGRSLSRGGGHNDRKLLAQTVPLGRQLRVLFVMLILGASVFHQLMLHNELKALSSHVGFDSLH